MRNYKIQQIGVMAFTVFAFASAGATTNYVDCSLSGYAGHDGTSWGKAFKTIQEGVDKCQEGDTVLVAPGIYSDGGKAAADEKGLNRVLISTRGITVDRREGRLSQSSKGYMIRNLLMGMAMVQMQCAVFISAQTTVLSKDLRWRMELHIQMRQKRIPRQAMAEDSGVIRRQQPVA